VKKPNRTEQNRTEQRREEKKRMSLNGKIHVGVYLIAIVRGVRKSLQMDDQYFRNFPQLELL